MDPKLKSERKRLQLITNAALGKTLSRLGIRITVAEMVAKAQITSFNFPLRMPGELISGEVNLTNIGDETTSEVAGFFGVLVKTMWDGAEYERIVYSSTAPGETLTISFLDIQGGIGTMPQGAALIEIVARTRIAYEVFRVDDVIDWSISEGVPVSEPKPLIPLLLLGALALLLFGRK